MPRDFKGTERSCGNRWLAKMVGQETHSAIRCTCSATGKGSELKSLYWKGHGFILAYKRLEAGIYTNELD